MTNRKVTSITTLAIPATLFLGMVLLAVCFLRNLMAEDKKTAPEPAPIPVVDATGRVPEPRAKLRYQGKTFAEWRERLETELEPKSRIEAINVMIAFGVNGYGTEAAQAIFDAALTFKDVSDEADKVQQASRKLVDIGEPAVPLLLDAFDSKDTKRVALAFEILYDEVINSQRVRSLPESFRHGLAAYRPRLLRLARNKNFDFVMMAIQLIDKADVENEGFASLIVEFLGSDDIRKRHVALDRLPNVDRLLPRTEEASNYRPGVTAFDNMYEGHGCNVSRIYVPTTKPNASAAVPILIRLLTDSDSGIREKAVRRLACYGAEAKDAVPKLVKRLKRLMDEENDATLTKTTQADMLFTACYMSGSTPCVRTMNSRYSEHHYLIHTLGAIGPDARPALPFLKKMPGMKYIESETVIEALVCIDPFGMMLNRMDSK